MNLAHTYLVSCSIQILLYFYYYPKILVGLDSIQIRIFITITKAETIILKQ